MAPILGIYASGISGNLFAPSGAWDSIATVTVGAGGSNGFNFTSIPATYTHLQLRGIARGNRSGALDDFGIRFNGGVTNITSHTLMGNGSTVTATGSTATGYSFFTGIASASETSGTFSAFVIDILDYANTNKFKTFRALSGYDANGSGRFYLSSGVQLDTTAINQITGIPSNTTFVQYSEFALYGIKGN
jgi:hypothetical protein